jgi:hypothetical protein
MNIVFLDAFLIEFRDSVMPVSQALVLASPERTFPDSSIVAKPRVPETKVRYGLTFAI